MMKLMALVLRLFAKVICLFPLKRRIVFLSRQSSNLSLDYRLLIAEIHRQYPDTEVAVCINEPETKNKLSFVTGTLRQLRYAMTSQVVVVDGYVPAVCIPDKRPGVTVVQMWHALGAVKKFGYQSVGTAAGRSEKAAQDARMHRNYDTIIAGGAAAAPWYSEAFGYPEDAIVPLGLPRIDYLRDADPASPRARRMADLAEKYPFLTDRPCVLYAPTLRKGAGYENWLTDYVKALAESWDGDKLDLVVAAHPLDNSFDESLLATYDFLHVVRGASTIDLLGLVDYVITDYSAVAFEAGLLQRAVYFYIPDVCAYRQSPGLNIDLLTAFPEASSTDAGELAKRISADFSSSRKGGDGFSAFVEEYFQVVPARCSQAIAEYLQGCLKA